MFGYSRYGEDEEEEGTNEDVSYMDTLVAQAKERGKRKQQEAAFTMRSPALGATGVQGTGETSKTKKAQKSKKKKLAREHTVRNESLEERNARKLAAKLAKKKRKEEQRVAKPLNIDDQGRKVQTEDNVIIDTTTVGQEEEEEEEEEPLVVSEKKQKKRRVETLAKDTTLDDEHIMNDDDVEEEEEEEVGMDTEKVTPEGGDKSEPLFLEQLNYGYNKNVEAKEHGQITAVRNEDEDRIMDGQVPHTPVAPPMSVEESIKEWGLSKTLSQNLVDMDVSSFFPVQRCAIPTILKYNVADFLVPRDMCISAPTGSGKTLAFTVPIVQSLMRYSNQKKLHALVLLPSRELAIQVHAVFERVCMNTGVTVGIITGQRSFESEQHMLVGSHIRQPANPLGKINAKGYKSFQERCKMKHSNDHVDVSSDCAYSMIDILVCTPGRLLDHLEYTKAFSLKYVRFLVLDEADRLLSNAYHSWIHDLVSSIDSLSKSSVVKDDNKGESSIRNHSVMHRNTAIPLQRLLFSATLTDNPFKLNLLNVIDPIILLCQSPNTTTGEQMGEDGEGLGANFALPQTLVESVTTCTTAKRPLVLATMLTEAFDAQASEIGEEEDDDDDNEEEKAAAAEDDDDDDEEEEEEEEETNKVARKVVSRPQIVRNHLVCGSNTDMCLVFTTSVDTAHRLCRMLQLFNGENIEDVLAGTLTGFQGRRSSSTKKGLLFGGAVVEMNRNVAADVREEIMTECLQGHISILVATENMARGIDLPNVKLVINYDPPKTNRSYVHRVGRTARANRNGSAVTFLKSGQVGAFRKMRASLNASPDGAKTDVRNSEARLPKCKPMKKTEERISNRYFDSLKQLARALSLKSVNDVVIGE